jgi:hypothetical protein
MLELEHPATKLIGTYIKMKLWSSGTYREAWIGGRGTGGVDRRRGAELR